MGWRPVAFPSARVFFLSIPYFTAIPELAAHGSVLPDGLRPVATWPLEAKLRECAKQGMAYTRSQGSSDKRNPTSKT